MIYANPFLIVFLTLNSFLTQLRDFSCAGKYRDDDNGIRSGCCCNRRVFVKVILSHSHRRREKGHLECEKNETWNPFYHFRISSCECYFLTHDSTPSKTPKKKQGWNYTQRSAHTACCFGGWKFPFPLLSSPFSGLPGEEGQQQSSWRGRRNNKV